MTNHNVACSDSAGLVVQRYTPTPVPLLAIVRIRSDDELYESGFDVDGRDYLTAI
jgi:hypothetical protein